VIRECDFQRDDQVTVVTDEESVLCSCWAAIN